MPKNKITYDPEMLHTIFSEIALSIDENRNAHELFKISGSSHIHWLNNLNHDIDDLNDCFLNDEDIKKFLSRMDGDYEDTNTYIYNAVVPLIANCIEWLMWVRERRPTRLAPDRAKRSAKLKPSASKRSKSGAAGKA